MHVVSLSHGSAVRKLERAGVAVCVIDEPDDAVAVGAARGPSRATCGPTSSTTTCTGPRSSGRRRGLALRRGGPARPYVVGTVHSSRVRCDEDRERPPPPDPARWTSSSRSRRAIVEKIDDEGRERCPGRAHLQRRRPRALRPPGPVLHPPRGVRAAEPARPIVGVVARLEPEKGHPTLLDAWPAVLADVPEATLLIVGEGSRRDALEAQARRAADRSSASSSPAAATTSRRSPPRSTSRSCRRIARPRASPILEAMALSRPVVASNVGGIPEMIADGVTGLLVPPRDPEALAEAIIRLLRDHPYADTLATSRPRPRPRPLLRRADGPRRRGDLRRGCPDHPPERGRGRLGRSGDLHRRRAG